MKKFSLIFYLCLSGLLQAQFDFNTFTKDTELLKSTLLNSCYLVRQDYIIEDSAGSRYGWQHKPYFNKVYSIAVLSDGYLWTSAEIDRPCQNDTLFQRFQKTYTPVKTATYLKAVNAPALSTFDTSNLIFDTLQNDLGRAFKDSLNLGLSQLPTDSEAASENNYRALAFYAPQDKNPENVILKTRFYQIDSLDWKNSDLAAAKDYSLQGKKLISMVLLHYKIGCC